MKYEEIDNHVDRAWFEFFTYLSEQGFDCDKMRLFMDYKDCYNASIDCAMECAPEGEEDE